MRARTYTYVKRARRRRPNAGATSLGTRHGLAYERVKALALGLHELQQDVTVDAEEDLAAERVHMSWPMEPRPESPILLMIANTRSAASEDVSNSIQNDATLDSVGHLLRRARQ